jgi:hypothetical protein
LQRLAQISNPSSSLHAANMDAAIKVAFAGFLRSGEFTIRSTKYTAFDPSCHLTRGSISFLPSFDDASSVSLTLPASKTDPFRKGITIYIAAVEVPTCAVRALQFLFTADPRPPCAPLFCNADGSPFRYSVFVDSLRSLLLSAGFDPTPFAGHSFRRGAATAAANAGFTEYEIQMLGRWQSDSYKLYVESSRSRILNLSARLHWAVPIAHPPGHPALRLTPSLA